MAISLMLARLPKLTVSSFKFHRPLSTTLTPLTEDTDILTYVYTQFDEAVKHLVSIQYNKLTENWCSIFRTCNSVLKFTLPIVRDNKKKIAVEAFRAHHQYFTLPCYGGVRISPEIDVRKLEAMTIHNSIKSGCYGIPFGGSKGAIKIDPQQFTENELRDICKYYVYQLGSYKMISSGLDVLGPCMGSSQREMGWMHDAYREIREHKDANYKAIVIGKNPNRGGLDGYIEATGFGIAVGVNYCLNNNMFCNLFCIPIGTKGKTVVIQGYGDVGSYTHKYLQEIGCKIIGIIEKNSGIYSKDGLEYSEIKEHWTKYRTFKTFTSSKHFQVMDGTQANELLKLQCDILTLAAAEVTINKTNVESIKAKMIIEGADMPVSSIAQKHLEEKGVVIIPDVLINGSNIVTSYIEWLKGRNGGRTRKFLLTMSKITLKSPWSHLSNTSEYNPMQSERSAIQIAIEDIIQQSCYTTLKYVQKHKVSMRTAAYSIAIEKIVQNFYECGVIY